MKAKLSAIMISVLLLMSLFTSCAPQKTEALPASNQEQIQETDGLTQDVTPQDTTSENSSSDAQADPKKEEAPAKAPVSPASPEAQAPTPKAKTPAAPAKAASNTAKKPAVIPPTTPVTPEVPATEESVPPAGQNVAETEPELVTAANSPLVTVDPSKVMSLDTDKGLLSIRYFLLYADKKSGDSILVRTPSGKNILIDSGVSDSAEQLVGYLNQLGIKRLDLLINTHPHSDHIGGMQTLINTFEVGDYYKSPREHDSSLYKKTMQALSDKNIPVHIVAEGDEIDLGDGLSFHVYNPPKDMDPNLYSNIITQLNCESLALMLTYHNIKLLLCGDLYQPGEVDMVARYPEGTFDADIVHAPHHGASTSSSLDYVIATTPQIAVMSTNSFQSQVVYDTYTTYGAVVIANSINGNLLITTDGDTVHAYVEEMLDPADVPKYSTGD